MPGPVIPKPVLIVKPQFHNAEGRWSNVMYFEVTGVVAAAEDVLALATSWCTAFGAKISPCMSEESNFDGLTATYISATHQWEVNSGAGSAPGDVSGESMPNQDAFEIRKYTDAPGRSARGRFYFSGMSEADTANGAIISTRYTPYNALAAFLGASHVVGDRTMNARHWNRKANTLMVITTCKAIRRLVSQRSRAKKEAYDPILN